MKHFKKSSVVVAFADSVLPSDAEKPCVAEYLLTHRIRATGDDVGHSKQVLAAREEFGRTGRSKAYKAEKLRLPAVYWNAKSFEPGKKGEKGCVKEMSGLMYFDADGHTKEEVLRSGLGPYVYAMWESVSGNGVGGLVLCEGISVEDVPATYAAMQEVSGGLLDASAFQAERANFLSVDRDLYLNRACWDFPIISEEKNTVTDGASRDTGFVPTIIVSIKKGVVTGRTSPNKGLKRATARASRKGSVKSSFKMISKVSNAHATHAADPLGPDFLFSTFIVSDIGSERSDVCCDSVPLSHTLTRSSSDGPFFQCGFRFFEEGFDAITLYLPKKIKVGSRVRTLISFAVNFYAIYPGLFCRRHVTALVNRIGSRLEAMLEERDVDRLYESLVSHVERHGGFAPSVVRKKIIFKPDSNMTTNEKQKASAKAIGDAAYAKNDASMREYAATYAGSAKLTQKVIAEGTGIGERTVKRHWKNGLCDIVRKKNEELNLIKTKRSRTGSLNESEPENNRKAQLGIESSPRESRNSAPYVAFGSALAKSNRETQLSDTDAPEAAVQAENRESTNMVFSVQMKPNEIREV